MKIEDVTDPQLYANWTDEELRDHIAKLRQLYEKRTGFPPVPSRPKLMEMLDPTGGNFMGSGLRFEEYAASIEINRLNESFFRQSREEKRRRLGYIIKASQILGGIEALSRFGTGLARTAIEDIIVGDWVGVRIYADAKEWAADEAHLPVEIQQAWQAFRAVLQEAFDTRPGAAPQPEPKN